MKKFVNIFIISSFILLSMNLVSCVQSQDHIIHFDCLQTDKVIHYLSEINCGPLPNHDNHDGVDLTKQYQEVGIDFIRTHDFNGPTDVSSIFPDFSLDPFLESSYNFSISDRYISGIINAGCKVFYRLGESASIEEQLRQPPSNFTKWAEICKHIIMHYNDGWADGYNYNIKYFEIWNEPDLMGFFNGTAGQYYELYRTTAEKLKEYNPSLKIGGPCTSSINNVNYTTGFLTYVLEHNIPLDFYSWHMYADTPFQIYEASKNVRNLLDNFGLKYTESINTEWNINIGFPQRDKNNAKNAAFTTSTLTLLQDTGIDYAFRYRGTGDNNLLARFIGFDLSLFSYDGTYKTPSLSYKIMNIMEKKTPKRIQTEKIGGLSGITYLGGISEDQSNISILISNYEVGDQEYQIILDNIPWNSSYTIVHYVIDDSSHFEIKEEYKMNSSSIELSETIKSSTVHFLWLTNTSLIPDEGPETLKIPILMQLKILDPIRFIFAMAFMMIFFD